MILQKLEFKIYKFFKLFFLSITYHKKFIHGKINFRKRFNIFIEKSGKIVIGNNCFFNNDCSLNCIERIEIGNNSIFGENVKIYDHNHMFYLGELILRQPLKSKKVFIGSNVWIGSNVTILAGTSIGDNCVISAGVILTGNVPSNTIVKRSSENYYFEEIKNEKLS